MFSSGKSHNSTMSVSHSHTHKSLSVGTFNRGHSRSTGRPLPSKSNHSGLGSDIETKINELEDKFRHTDFNYK